MNHERNDFHGQNDNGFFLAADEPAEHDTSSDRRYNDPDRDNDKIYSFYHEESSYQHSFSQSSAPIFSQLSQSSNLSVAELSRMDESAQESMLSQSSHHDIEIDRQRKKIDRKRKRGDASVVKRKRSKYHLSERQMKRSAIYSRFRYEKSIDVSQEQDVGDSIEYLVRRKLMEPSEQRRLMNIAKEREAAKKKEEHDAAWKEADSLMGIHDDTNRKSTSGEDKPDDNKSKMPAESKSEPNWDFLDDGYVTMPRDQAKGLPYFIFNLSNRKLGQSKKSISSNTFSLESDIVDSSEDERAFVSTSRSRRFLSSNSSVSTASTTARQIDWDSSKQHFPLSMNRLNQKMDLRSNLTMGSRGRDSMTLLHGRIARRFLARLVAGGVTCDMAELFTKNKLRGKKQSIDEDLASDISQSCDSSESDNATNIYGGFDYQSQFNSQLTAGSTSIIDMNQNCNLDGTEEKNSRNNSLIGLLSLIHMLPTFTHPIRFYIKIATELGRLRQLHENASSSISNVKLKVVKSFMGVDGNIFPGPFWCSDAAMPTDILKLYDRVRKIRRSLMPSLRGLVPKHIDEQLDMMQNQLPVSGNSMETYHNHGDAIMGERGAKSIGTKYSETSDLMNIETEDRTNEIIGYQAGIDAAPANEFMQELSGSLIDINQFQMSLPGSNVVKYAKVVHEANMDGANIGISLASFLNELTSSRYGPQQQDSLPPSQKGKSKPSTTNIGIWNETINEYLLMVENESRPSDINLNKREGKAPQCITLARSAMARQSYVSNNGGLSCMNKKEMKIEGNDSDEYDEEHYATYSATRENSLHTIQLSVGDIVKNGKEHFVNENLHLFTPIHLATGVAMLTEHLTPLSIEIVSRPCSSDGPEFHTAFDKVRQALAGLEERRELISKPTDEKSRWEARGKVIDEVLVSSWVKAAVIFRRCIKESPYSIEHWTWYVATLLGIVCVSSGESLSNIEENSDDLCNKNEQDRYELDHFDKKRECATQAIVDFIKMTNNFDCPMFHMSLSSMFEWKQGVSLVAHQSLQLDGVYNFSCSEIKRLHTNHVSIYLYYTNAFHFLLLDHQSISS